MGSVVMASKVESLCGWKSQDLFESSSDLEETFLVCTCPRPDRDSPVSLPEVHYDTHDFIVVFSFQRFADGRQHLQRKPVSLATSDSHRDDLQNRATCRRDVPWMHLSTGKPICLPSGFVYLPTLVEHPA